MSLFEEFTEAGYKLHTNGAVNIFGIRKTPYKLNVFNDEIQIFWKDLKQWVGHSFPATTLPGKFWLNNLINPEGAAILKSGQYLNAYKLGKHKGKDALIQCANVTVYRDANKDDNFNLLDEDTGMFGINIHRAGFFSHFVNSWSAGCQVFKKEKDFNSFIEICKERACFSNDLFHYTLIEQEEPDFYEEH